MVTSTTKTKGGILMTVAPPLNELDFANETTIAELDAIAKHHHAGHPYYSCMPFSTESVQVSIANEMLKLRGINPKLITWLPHSKYGFCLRIKQKANRGMPTTTQYDTAQLEARVLACIKREKENEV